MIKIVVVGGGSAGWITATWLQKHLKCDLTVIHKKMNHPIGVGEGTTPNMNKVIDHIDRVTKFPGEIVILFKPQFEVGKENLTKNGIVKDPKISVDTLSSFISGLDQTFLEYQNTVDSEVKGKNGNQEIFIYLKK